MLSQRLLAISKMVEKNSIVADVGSDHGLLPCFLVKNNISKKVYAIDNKEGPLSSAKKTIEHYNLEDQVIPVLSEGLNQCHYDDFDTIVIAGMGYSSIIKILEDYNLKESQVQDIIVQSNTHVPLLRKAIIEANFYIDEEILIKEKNQFYFIIKFKLYPKTNYAKEDYLIGPKLKKDKVYKEYLELKINSLEKIVPLKNSSKLKEELKILKKYYKTFE